MWHQQLPASAATHRPTPAVAAPVQPAGALASTQTAEGDRAEGRQTPDTASSEEPAAPASGKAQQAAEKRKKKKRKKRKKKKLGRRERLAAREAAAKAAAAVPSADEDAPRTDVSGWTDLRAQGVHLHSAIVDNLQGLGFAAPTPIQSQALPAES